MTKEQYNSLADYRKETYDKWNRGNKAALLVSWALGAVVFVIIQIAGLSKGDPIGGIAVGLALGVVVAALLPGIVHLGFIFKKIGFGNTILLWIVLGIFLLMLYAFMLMIIWYAGIVFLVIDTILFIMKKPLIYRWEDKRVLEKAERQVGAYINKQ